jgi:hypothetical protein
LVTGLAVVGCSSEPGDDVDSDDLPVVYGCDESAFPFSADAEILVEGAEEDLTLFIDETETELPVVGENVFNIALSWVWMNYETSAYRVTETVEQVSVRPVHIPTSDETSGYSTADEYGFEVAETPVRFKSGTIPLLLSGEWRFDFEITTLRVETWDFNEEGVQIDEYGRVLRASYSFCIEP